jgi:cytochrome c-type biogenesis protein CcmH
MIIFWLICALFVIIALAFILPTLMQAEANSVAAGRKEANIAVYRDQIDELEADLRNGLISQEQYQQDRDEIEKRLLEDVSAPDATRANAKREKQPAASRAQVYAVAFGIPLIGVAMYLQVGNRNAITGVPTTPLSMSAATSQRDAQPANDQQRIETNVAALAKRLQENPSDAQGWMMLAKSYTTMQKYADAAAAYEKAAALRPDDADLLADYAFAVAMKNGRRLEGQPTELLQKALKLDPENAKALQLSGSAAFEARNYTKAVEYWQKVLQKAGPDSELGQVIAGRIAEAKKLSQTK